MGFVLLPSPFFIPSSIFRLPHFSAAHIAYSHKLHRMWNGYITTMGLDLREMTLAAKESLGSVEASLTAVRA